MKTMIINNRLRILLILGCMFSLLDLYAQESYVVSVNNVRIHSVMTKDKIIDIFGIPDNYTACNDELNECFIETYEYGNNTLILIDNRLEGFDIQESGWIVMPEYFDKGLQIGDLMSELERKQNFKLMRHNYLQDCYYILDAPMPITPPTSYMMIRVSNDRIVSISYDEQI